MTWLYDPINIFSKSFKYKFDYCFNIQIVYINIEHENTIVISQHRTYESSNHDVKFVTFRGKRKTQPNLN